MDQALTNKKFIEQIDDVIETLGGTPVDLELTEDREDDMVSNGVFVDKMDEVIEALGGTPSEIIVGDDKADDMVSDNIFQLKMEDVVKNMSGGGGGGSSDFSTATVTFNLTLPEGKTLDSLGGRVGFEFEDGIEYEAPLSTSATTLPIVLYKGEGYISNFYAETTDYDNLIFDGEPTLSDTVTWDGDKFTVTGDGTVTATMVVEGGSD